MQDMEDPNDAIRHKFQRLEELAKRIQGLEDQLHEAREAMRKLGSEIMSYQYERPTKIQKLPPELLYAVFRHYVDDNPSAIRRLVQVCRQWYKIAKSNKDLWTYIRIKIEPDEDVESVKSRARYIKACFDGSGNLPLELEVDFDRLGSLSDFCAKVTHDALLPLFEIERPHTNEAYSIPDDSQTRVRQWIDARHCPEAWVSRHPLPLNEIYEENCAHLLRFIASAHVQCMARCRSFKFTGPVWEWTMECDHYVYSLLQRPMPLLEELTLSRVPPAPSHRYTRYTLHPNHLDQLRVLKLENSLSFRHVATSTALSQLRILSIDGTWSEEDIYPLFQCVNLTELRMHGQFSWSRSSPLNLDAVTFEKLISLSVESRFPEKIFEKMDLPALADLTVGLDAISRICKADFVSRVPSFCILPRTSAQREQPDYPGYQEMLRANLSLFRSMEVLKIDLFCLDLFKDTVRYIAGQRNDLQCLRTLLVIDRFLEPVQRFSVEHLHNGVQFVDENGVSS